MGQQIWVEHVGHRDPLTHEVDPKSFKRRFSRDNWVADRRRRRASGFGLFFQWRRSAVGTDTTQKVVIINSRKRH